MGDPNNTIDRTTRRDGYPNPDHGSPASPAPTDASLRAASYSRLDAWILGGHDFDADGTDANPSPPTGAPRTPVLFLKETDDANAISPDDVRQGQLGDCALHAALVALASTPEGRARIQGSVQERKDAGGNVGGYSVKLYEMKPRLLGLELEATWIHVATTSYAKGHATARGDGAHDEIWPLVIEKAYAQLRGSYTRIGNGSAASRVLETLTGRSGWQMAAAKVNDVTLVTALAAHHAVVFSRGGS